MRSIIPMSYRHFAIFLIAISLTGTAYADKPKATELEARIAALEARVNRLHGSAAAVVPVGLGGSTGGNVVFTAALEVQVCPAGTVPTGSFCFDNPPGAIKVESQVFGTADQGAVITIDAANNPNFLTLAEAITNGIDDDIVIRTQSFADGAPGGGGASSSSERIFFGKDQVSSDVLRNDLEGLEVTSIRVAVDQFYSFYSQQDDSTEFQLRARVIFRVAD